MAVPDPSLGTVPSHMLGNHYLIKTLKLGMDDPRLDALATVTPMSPERRAWQLGVQALA